MNNFFGFLILIFCSLSSYSQNVGIGTTTPDSSAALEIKSSSQGFLPPRLTTTQRNAITNPAIGLQIYNTTTDCLEIFAKGRWQPIYCATAAPNPINTDTTIITDIDGNAYPTVKICNQTWTAKNLNVSHYRNGDIIPQVTDPAQWASLTTGAWCWYNYESATYGATYGKLYNWYAVNDARGLAPEGWHVPRDGEWNSLANCLGGATIAGGKMKESGTTHWNIPNTDATNSSSFTGLPAGFRNFDGLFGHFGHIGVWWCSTDNNINASWAWNYSLYAEYSSLMIAPDGSKNCGYTIRCIKDTIPTTLTNGLVAYYPFNGNANDESGNGNNGTVNGATLTTDRFGYSNSSYATNSNNQYIKTQSVLQNISNTFTISLWANPQSTDLIIPEGVSGLEGFGQQSIIHPSHGANWGNQSLNAGVGINVGSNQIDITEHTHLFISSPLVYAPSSNLNGWHNIILVYSSHVPRLYVDRVLVKTGLISSIQNIRPSNGFDIIYPNSGFGNSFTPNGTPTGQFVGSFDDIRIYNRALTQEEITYLATH